jgi:hypothetical protein
MRIIDLNERAATNGTSGCCARATTRRPPSLPVLLARISNTLARFDKTRCRRASNAGRHPRFKKAGESMLGRIIALLCPFSSQSL